MLKLQDRVVCECQRDCVCVCWCFAQSLIYTYKWKTATSQVVVLPNNKRFDYPSHVVMKSDQDVALNSLASKIMTLAV